MKKSELLFGSSLFLFIFALTNQLNLYYYGTI